MTAAIVVDDRSVLEAFNRLLATGQDPRPQLDTIGDDLANNIRLRIRESRSPDGSPFAPLSPVTIARRRGGGKGAKPLLDTGRFANGISHRVDANSVEVGTNAIQGPMLHFGAAKGAFGRTSRGAPIPWGNVPARPWLGVSVDDRAGMLEVFAEAIQRAAA